jgi:hypothetical protein
VGAICNEAREKAIGKFPNIEHHDHTLSEGADLRSRDAMFVDTRKVQPTAQLTQRKPAVSGHTVGITTSKVQIATIPGYIMAHNQYIADAVAEILTQCQLPINGTTRLHSESIASSTVHLISTTSS